MQALFRGKGGDLPRDELGGIRVEGGCFHSGDDGLFSLMFDFVLFETFPFGSQFPLFVFVILFSFLMVRLDVVLFHQLLDFLLLGCFREL